MAIPSINIKQITLFTNRNTIFYDRSDEMIPDYQRMVAWEEGWYGSDLDALLERVYYDQPQITLASYKGGWSQDITIEEFMCLINRGRWYYDFKRGLTEKGE